MDTTVGKRRLEILEVADPCSESWDAMEGDARSRQCALCVQTVYDLSEMSTADVEALLTSPERVCVRFYRRADGRVTTKDCQPLRVRAARAVVRGTIRGAAKLASFTLALLVLLGFAQLAGLDPVRWADKALLGRTMGEPMPTMGAVAIDETTPHDVQEQDPPADELGPEPE